MHHSVIRLICIVLLVSFENFSVGELFNSRDDRSGLPTVCFYNDRCEKQCQLAGLICENQRCICNRKMRLFWTGARCMPCEDDWSMSETGCIGLYQTKVSWTAAKDICRQKKSELISFRNTNAALFLHQLLKAKNLSTEGGWTSAYAVDPNAKDIVYKWLDETMPKFDNRSDWWCRNTTANMGYTYPYNEPTQFMRHQQREACIMYRASIGSVPVVCLDDQLCNASQTFACEKSEFVAMTYLGPPPVTQVSGTMAGTSKSSTKINSPTDVSRKNEKNSLMISVIVGTVFVLLFSALAVGIFYICRQRQRQAITHFETKPVTSGTTQFTASTVEQSSYIQQPVDNGEAPSQPIFSSVAPKIEAIKRSGYTKQQFDEFD